MTKPRVALAHDYLTQRGGAERVVATLAQGFPAAPIHTSVFEPTTTFDDFDPVRVHTTDLQRIGAFRRNARLALPLLGPAVGRNTIEAQVTICSTSGWAHGFPTTGLKVAYVHNTARWLYQRDEYLADLPRYYGWGLATLAPVLHRWDRRAAASIDFIFTNSRVVQSRVRDHWGRDAEVLHPPPGLDNQGEVTPVDRIDPGYWLAVARLLPYKRLDLLIETVAQRAGDRLVIVGTGPDEARLRNVAAALGAASRVSILTRVDDPQLRWLYTNADALVSAAHEDFGLAPLEALAFGTPTVAIDRGGFRETIADGETGLHFPNMTTVSLGDALDRSRSMHWDRDVLAKHGETFGADAFVTRISDVISSLTS